VTVVYSVLESANIAALFPILQSMLGSAVPKSAIFVYIDRFVALLPFRDRFIAACLLAAFILIAKECLGFVRQVLVSWTSASVVCDKRQEIFAKFVDSNYQYFLDNKQGNLIYILLGATARLGNCLQYIPDMISAIFMTVAVSAVLIAISPQATLFLAVVGIAYNMITHMISRKISYILGKARTTLSAEANVIANEFLDGIKYIKAFGLFKHWVESFGASVRRLKKVINEDAIWMAIPDRLIYILPPAVLISLAVFFRYYYKDADNFLLSNLASIGVYALALLRLLPSLTLFGRMRLMIVGSLADVELLYDALNERTHYIKDGDRELKGFYDEIRFEDISFSYKGRREILKGINLTIKKGQTVAVVGPSGVGKTTLVNLIIKLFEPTGGRITIDGMDIRQISRSSLVNTIGLVSQETFIFNASIKENILFGLKGMDQKKIEDAATLANAHEFIMGFPEGYDTLIGDKGLKLSGGQRQRIAIARTVLRNPKILILDEATSSLDYNSEALVQKAINDVSKDRTTIVIAHRLSTVVNADKIVVLDDGRIVEEGPHRELIKSPGIYRSLYEKQENVFLGIK
jgi:subfamily B ATP-binding cassette protein MsbA